VHPNWWAENTYLSLATNRTTDRKIMEGCPGKTTKSDLIGTDRIANGGVSCVDVFANLIFLV
jgi:hypothetical protein